MVKLSTKGGPPKRMNKRLESVKERIYTPEKDHTTLQVGSTAKIDAPRPGVKGQKNKQLEKEWRDFKKIRSTMPKTKVVQPVDPARKKSYKDGGNVKAEKLKSGAPALILPAIKTKRNYKGGGSVGDPPSAPAQKTKLNPAAEKYAQMLYNYGKKLPAGTEGGMTDEITRMTMEEDFKINKDDITKRARELFSGSPVTWWDEPSESGSGNIRGFYKPPPPKKEEEDKSVAPKIVESVNYEQKGLVDINGTLTGVPGKVLRKASGRKVAKKVQNLEEGGPVQEFDKEAKAKEGMLTMASDAAGDLITSGFNSAAENTLATIDSRTDPYEAMRKANKQQNAGNIIGGTAKGALTGASTAGPVGALVGGAVGLVSGISKAIFGNKKAKREAAEARSTYNKNWTGAYSSGLESTSFKEGGKIKGKGGPKEDKVPMKVPEGSFVVPAENAKKAMELGKKVLGWDGDEKASKKMGKSRINASNGEVIFTPEEVEELDFYGIDLNELAPNAEPGKRMDYKDGNNVETELNLKTNPLYNVEDTGYEIDDEGTLMDPNQTKLTADAYSKKGKAKEGEEPKTTFQKVMKYAPELFGALQASAGLYGLSTAKKIPDPSVSAELKLLARETQKLSEQGLDPTSKNLALKTIEQNRRSAVNQIVSRGGSAGEISSGMTQATSQANEGAERLAVADSEIKRSNKAPYFDALKAISSRKDDVNKEKRVIKEKKDEMYAALLQAGISNVIGARQFKDHMDYLKNIKSGVTITLPQ